MFIGEGMKVKILDNEYWWFAQVTLSHKMPFTKDTEICGSLTKGNGTDQYAPLGVSSLGRYIHADGEFDYEIKNGEISFSDYGAQSVKLYEGFGNLKGAYLAAKDAHFPFCGKTPDLLFLEKPQYNTWIEFNVNQTQDGILGYAKSILDNGLPPGVLMIDNGWQENFGTFEFNARKIPDPKYLVDELHKMGFKVMLWVTPFIACADKLFMNVWKKGYLIQEQNGDPCIRRWWDGFSAVLDFSNPDAEKWFCDGLDSLVERYGVDGFKFDAGDYCFYKNEDVTYGNVRAREQTKLFNVIGERYSFNEFRAGWDCGGRAIVARLQDKRHEWDNEGLNMLIPHTIGQGLAGYAYCCPDMLGGGAEGCFGDASKLDKELFIRWAQANALMGMMQVSYGFWRVFDESTTNLILDSVKLHESVCGYCVELAKQAAKTGEPIVRHMDYEFPGQGFEAVNDQFMLGDKYLSAPIITKGQTIRKVKLPAGFKWKSDKGEIIEGGQTIIEQVPIERLAYYEKI